MLQTQKMKPESQLEQLPPELLSELLFYLDLNSLKILEEISEKLSNFLKSSTHFWDGKIKRYLNTFPEYSSAKTYCDYESFKTDPTVLRRFYTCLVKLDDNICNHDIIYHKSHVFNCTDALKGDVENQSTDTNGRNFHTNKGVYDLYLDKGRICASVHDTLQVWELRDFRLSSMIGERILGSNRTATTCYAMWSDYLICGTDVGYVRIVRLRDGSIVAKERLNTNYISEIVCVDKNLVFTVDIYGNIAEWQLQVENAREDDDSSKDDICLRCLSQSRLGGDREGVADSNWYVPEILRSRHTERLLAVNRDWVVTTCKTHICVYKRATKTFEVSFAAGGTVFCLELKGSLAAFGMKNFTGYPSYGVGANGDFRSSAGIADISTSAPRVLNMCFQEELGEPENAIVSLTWTWGANNILFLGNNIGDISIVSIDEKLLRLNQASESEELLISDAFRRRLAVEGPSSVTIKEVPGATILPHVIRTNEFGSIVWGLEWDGCRLVSGSSSGHIIVHDFLQFREEVPELGN